MFSVTIQKSGKKAAHVKVTHRDPDSLSLGVTRTTYVTASFGNVEEKARKKADRIILDWKKQLHEQKSAIRYTVQ